MANRFILDLQIAVASRDNLPTKRQIVQWLDATLSLFRSSAELTVRIVEEKEMRRLNDKYRNKDGSTNVLSFPFETPTAMPVPLLGDIIICKEVIEKEAMVQNKNLQSHWAHMVVHGILHLLNYDHNTDKEAQQMEKLEIEIMSTLGYENPYLCDDEQKAK